MDVSVSWFTVAVYSNAIQDNINSLLYPGFIEELVDIIELKMNNIVVSIEELLNNNNIIFISEFFMPWISSVLRALDL